MGRRQRTKAARTPTAPAPAASERYTPPAALHIRVRPVWHKVLGWFTVAVGVGVVIINYLDYDNLRILPGGHNEGYFILGIAIAATSLWWFGAFDRDPDPEEIRREMARQRADRAAGAKGRP